MVGALSAFLALAALLGPFAASLAASGSGGQADPSVPQADLRSAILGGVAYAALAALLAWIGVGSIRAGRWVRPVVLILAWTWLMSGIMMLVFWILMIPDLPDAIRAAQPAQASLDPSAIRAVILLASFMLFVLTVALPVALVLFYQDSRREIT